VHRLLVAIVLVTVLAACGGDDNDTAGTVAPVSSDEPVPTTPAPTTPTTSRRETSTSPTFSATSLPPAERVTTTLPGSPIDPSTPLVVAAVDDLAGRLGLDPAAVTVVEARAVTWGDSSLGCPQPGMQYLQRLVDGTLVILKAGGRSYEYHGGDPLFLCENPRPPSGGGGGTG
jgi:hypothetical protein